VSLGFICSRCHRVSASRYHKSGSANVPYPDQPRCFPPCLPLFPRFSDNRFSTVVGEVCRWSFELKLGWTGQDDIQTICDYAKGICASKKSGHASASQSSLCGNTSRGSRACERRRTYPSRVLQTALQTSGSICPGFSACEAQCNLLFFRKCLERTCDVLNRQLNYEGTTRIRPFPGTAASAVRVVASDGK
jgi:hypothetical protein